ncbi:PREDICTED: lateral signaling target protein 2 homolog [Papilio xuthus]|uniref:Lateral signaling target protein 2 homolog n=1 Tax=Papilio xuthus TaxID=66420 RepID=A0AAJ6Z5B2_PAPXU|nr:PREDICTED: lateral signaling target protein 2 homolog [Papilio xuthus]
MRLLYKTGPMDSLRKWFRKPKREDQSLLAQFFFADDALNIIASELDSFDGRKDPERCSTLVTQLRLAQDRVLNVTSQIMDEVLGEERVARGFRVKFPEDVLQDNLAGQLWFGAECLAAGSSIMNREEESAAMRPLAKALTRSLETVRSLLREQCLRSRDLALSPHDDMLHESLRIFDRLFAEFELCYVSAMVNVKTPHEFEAQQLICVLFSESLRRALKQGLLTQEQVDSYDPALMFAVPRLAIVSGLLIYSSGPLSIDKPPEEMSDMFRPFRTLLHKIRSLLWTLDRRELMALERLLCTNEDISNLAGLDLPQSVETLTDSACHYPDIGEFVSKFYADHAHCRDLYATQSCSEPTITDADYLPDNIEVMTPIIDGLRRLTEDPDDTQTDEETIDSKNNDHRHYSDTTSTDTFQTNDSKDLEKSRKTSRTESNDLSSLRNLSTNGLMMFDPLVINAVSASTSSENRQLPDNDLVTSLNEQVTEIADRLSSIATDIDIQDHNQMHSLSTNDVPTLLSTEDSDFGFSGPRNEPLSCMPSTSHGYLIPNAISQEPVVLASLSHNNSAVFNQEDEEVTGAILNSEIPLIMPDNIEAEIVNTNICIANANLSSLLLTNDEFRQNFVDNNDLDADNASFHSAKMTLDRDERVKFMLGYDSEQESPVDSGVSTENTSLDRSPDTDQSKDNFMQQNRVIKDLDEDRREDRIENYLERSFSNDDNVKQAGPSNIEIHRISSEEDGLNEAANVKDLDWTNKEQISKDSIKELRRSSEVKSVEESRSSTAATHSGRQRKSRKSSKNKKKKMWPPGIVILDNRNTQAQNPLRLNLDHIMDESGTSCGTSECADDEQIALALQAQELAARQQARGKFKSSEDLIHRLFVCIAGVADQLQTNFAADLRNILKSVFLMNQTPDPPEEEPATCDPSDKGNAIEYEVSEDQVIQNGSSFDSVYSAEEVYADSSDSSPSESSARLARRNTVTAARDREMRRNSLDAANLQASVSIGDLTYRDEERGAGAGGAVGASAGGAGGVERAPEWVPDIAAPACMRCAAHFTAFRRRHHCRNCGKVFCASCSSNSIPLPRYGQMKPVRVCEECYQSTRRPNTPHTHQR